MLYLALGSNLGHREENLRQALRLLGERVGRLTACSRFRETAPAGFNSPHLFLNAAAAFNSELSPEQVLAATQQIERDMGRTAKSRHGQYADRLIDIDMLFFGSRVISTDMLSLPHPLLHRRRFVLEPMAEIAPTLCHPLLKLTMQQLLDRLNTPAIRRITQCSDDVLAALNALLPQLSDKAAPLAADQLAELLTQPLMHLFGVYDEENHLCGMGTLTFCPLPTGTKAWIDDVVVDSDCRGRGYARCLVERLIHEARQGGAKSLNLTSRPEREAANRLYRRIGFLPRATNVYALTL